MQSGSRARLQTNKVGSTNLVRDHLSDVVAEQDSHPVIGEDEIEDSLVSVHLRDNGVEGYEFEHHVSSAEWRTSDS